MSHWTTIKTQVKDLTALSRACTQLGLPLLADSTARGYSRQTMKADYVIRLPGPYDIAVKREADGTLGFTTDWYLGHVAKVVGEGYEKLLAEYNHAVCALAAEAAGQTWHRVGSEAEATALNESLGLYGEAAVAYTGTLMTAVVA